MYGEVKNLFGIREGKHITVNDLREDERGLACNCACPLCGDRFEARLGSQRIHHFAHNGEGCDEIAAYLMGLYGFFRDYLLSNPCPIPALTIYYQVNKYSYTAISVLNYKKEIFLQSYGAEKGKKKVLSSDMSIRFDSAEIITSKNKYPEAIIAKYHDKKLAFVIAPPDTICKDFIAKPYKEMATLEILLSKKSDLISRANSEMMNAVFSDIQNYQWLSSPMVFTAFSQINAERKIAYDSYKKELEQEREKARIEFEAREKARKEAEKKYQEELIRQKQIEEAKEREAKRRLQEELVAKRAEVQKRKMEFLQSHPKLQKVYEYLLSHKQITAEFTVIQSDNSERRFIRTFEGSSATYDMRKDRFRVGDAYIYTHFITGRERVMLRGSSALFLVIDLSFLDVEDISNYLDQIVDHSNSM